MNATSLTRLPDGVDFVHGDVRNSDVVEQALAGIDAVCHQAAMVGLGLDGQLGLEALAKRLFGDEDPIEKRVTWTGQVLSAIGIFIMRQYLLGLPRDLIEFMGQKGL